MPTVEIQKNPIILAFPHRVKVEGKGQFRFNLDKNGKVDDMMKLDSWYNVWKHCEEKGMKKILQAYWDTYNKGKCPKSYWK